MVSGQTFKESFGDVRLDVRGNALIRDLWVRGSRSIRQVAGSYPEQKAYYRFFENERTSEKAIIQSMAQRCGSAVKNRMVLVFQDTTEINLYKHRNRIKQDDSTRVDECLGRRAWLYASPFIGGRCDQLFSVWLLPCAYVQSWNGKT